MEAHPLTARRRRGWLDGKPPVRPQPTSSRSLRTQPVLHPPPTACHRTGRTHPGRARGPRAAVTLPCSAPLGLAFLKARPEEVKRNWSLQKDWVTWSNTCVLAEGLDLEKAPDVS